MRLVVAAIPHVEGRTPGSHGALVGAHLEPAPQAVAADWEAYPVVQGRGALHQGEVEAVTLGAGSAVHLVASPSRWSQVVGPCDLVSMVDPWVLPAVAGALLEGACVGGLVAVVLFVGALPQWAVGPAGWLAMVVGDHSEGAVAAGEVVVLGGALGVAGVPPASLVEAGSCVRAHLECTEGAVGPAQSAVAPQEACVPGLEKGGFSLSGPGVKDPGAPADPKGDPCHYHQHPSGTGRLSSDRTSPCSDPCGARPGKTHHTLVTVTKPGWACDFASQSGSDADDCTSLPPGSDHEVPSWATFP